MEAQCFEREDDDIEIPVSSTERVRAYRKRQKRKGKCSTCGKRKPKPNRKTCAKCLARKKTGNKRQGESNE